MKKRYISVLLTFCMAISLLTVGAAAEDWTPVESTNAGAQNYDIWASPVKSYLVDNGDGTTTRVESIDDEVVVEQYDLNGNPTGQTILPNELSLFGGFYAGEAYNFLVFGMPNDAEDDNAEVIRVVRYTKDWQRVDAASLCGANTTMPFDAGSLRMVQCGDMLYVRTGRQMYQTDDGYCHQSNLTFSVQISTMTVTDQSSEMSDISTGYVSHSFNQFIAVHASELVAVDHGDTYPRSVVLIRYNQPAGETTFAGACSNIDVLPIRGEEGDNYTGVCVGGFEVSDSAYIVAGNSIDQQSDAPSDVRNIFVTSTPVDDFTQDATSVRWITNYDADGDVSASAPQLVKVDGNRLLLLWMANDVCNYVFLDGAGNVTSEVGTMDATLSDCKPIIMDGKAMWYSTNQSAPVFGSVDAAASEHVHTYEDPEWNWSDDYTSAEAMFTCTSCGEQITVDAVVTKEDKGEDTAISTATVTLDDTVYTDTQEQVWSTVPPEPRTSDVTQIFTDVPEGAWYTSWVQQAYDKKLMSGTSETTFSPHNNMTRATIVQMLYNMEGKPEVPADVTRFTDVKAGAWYDDSSTWAKWRGVSAGYTDGTFRPNEVVTREQIAVFLYQYAGSPEASGTLSAFTDANRVSSWAADAVTWCVQQELIAGIESEQGTRSLEPKSSASRAQGAVMLVKFVEYTEGADA